jgi:YtoQ family protein
MLAFQSFLLSPRIGASGVHCLLCRRTQIIFTNAMPVAATRSNSSSGSQKKIWNVYLSGEIHSDWRQVIARGVTDLPVVLTSPNTSHEDSDDCGAVILGMQEERPNWDAIGARMNQVRTVTAIRAADVVVVRFGDSYRQWNAAFDAGFAFALNKPLITLHLPELGHMLKEVDAAASVVCHEPEQVVQTLAYVIDGTLPAVPKDGDAYVPIAERLGKGNPNP